MVSVWFIGLIYHINIACKQSFGRRDTRYAHYIPYSSAVVLNCRWWNKQDLLTVISIKPCIVLLRKIFGTENMHVKSHTVEGTVAHVQT